MQNQAHLLFSATVLLGALIFLYFLITQVRPAEQKLFGADVAYFAKLMGVVTGILLRLWIAISSDLGSRGALQNAISILSIGFLCGTPFVIGVVSEYFAIIERGEHRRRIGKAIIGPWGPVITATLIVGVLGIEGIICIVMMLPLWLGLASIGGLAGRFAARRKLVRSGAVLCAALLLPVLVTIGEAPFPAEDQIATVENTIDIDAAPGVVWNEIKSVRKIEASEHRPSLFTSMGFPRPLEAVLDSERVGGIRRATFEGGVVFTETVTAFQPGKEIAFTIKANTDQIPASTMDEHIKIGGQYFDVLNGRYVIEPLSEHSVRLHLSSQHRLSTHLNWYAGLWSSRIMGSIQSNILSVIKDRAEAAPAGPRN